MLHVSFKGFWWLVELIPDRRYSFKDQASHWHFFNFAQPRFFLGSGDQPRAHVHESVTWRMEQRADYRPANLPANAEALRAACQIEA